MGKSIEKRTVHIRSGARCQERTYGERDWKDALKFCGGSGSCRPVFIQRGSQFHLERGAAIVIKGLLELTQRHISVFCWSIGRGYKRRRRRRQFCCVSCAHVHGSASRVSKCHKHAGALGRRHGQRRGVPESTED